MFRQPLLRLLWTILFLLLFPKRSSTKAATRKPISSTCASCAKSRTMTKPITGWLWPPPAPGAIPRPCWPLNDSSTAIRRTPSCAAPWPTSICAWATGTRPAANWIWPASTTRPLRKSVSLACWTAWKAFNPVFRSMAGSAAASCTTPTPIRVRPRTR